MCYLDSDLFGMASYYDSVYGARQSRLLELKRRADGDSWDTFKRRKLNDDTDVIELPVHFNK